MFGNMRFVILFDILLNSSFIMTTSFAEFEKDHSMIEMRRLKNVIFIQTILSTVLPRKMYIPYAISCDY